MTTSDGEKLWRMGRRAKKELGSLGAWWFTRSLPVAAMMRNNGGADIVFLGVTRDFIDQPKPEEYK